MKSTLRALLLPLLLVAACRGAAPTVTEAAQAGVVARQVADDPAKGAAALAENGWTEAEFEALLYDIAADPGLTQAYISGLWMSADDLDKSPRRKN